MPPTAIDSTEPTGSNPVSISEGITIGEGHPFVLFGGPCVIESRDHCLKMAEALGALCEELRIPYVFKASYDKANRTSIDSYRGPGLEKGLAILREVKERFALPLITDFHGPEEATQVGAVVDILQIPALLSRQTDMIQAAAETGRVVNIKKGQFLAPWDLPYAIEKADAGHRIRVLITERGTLFGYNNVVVDFRTFPLLQDLGVPVVFDVTHSVQLPGGKGTSSGGDPRFIRTFARAGLASGVDGLYIETHDNPQAALCDGPIAFPLAELPSLLTELKELDQINRGRHEPRDRSKGS